jgi:hypothetical protein
VSRRTLPNNTVAMFDRRLDYAAPVRCVLRRIGVPDGVA